MNRQDSHEEEVKAWMHYVDVLVETGVIDEWIRNSASGNGTIKNQYFQGVAESAKPCIIHEKINNRIPGDNIHE